MKNTLLVLSLAGTLLCLLLFVQKEHQVSQAQARLVAAEQRQAASASELAEHQRRLQRLQEEWQLTAPAPPPLAAFASNSVEQSASGPRENLSAIFRDAAMQEMLKDEARAGAARNVNALFNSGLAQRLQLNEEQTAALRELLLRKANLFWERMLLPMMTGELDDSAMREAGRSLKQLFEANTAELQSLLGAAGYETCQWFEKTQSERDQARQFITRFAEAGQALTEEQKSELTSIMVGERADFIFTFDPGDPAQLDFERWYDNFSVERIETFGTELQRLNERVLQRAQSVLSPEQLALFQSLLNRQLQKGRLTMLTTTAALGQRR